MRFRSWCTRRCGNSAIWIAESGALVGRLKTVLQTIKESSQFAGGAMNLQLGAGLTAGWTLAFALWGGLRGRVHYTPAGVCAAPTHSVNQCAAPVGRPTVRLSSRKLGISRAAITASIR